MRAETLRPLVQSILLLCSFAAILFISAGRFDWAMAWAFLGAYATLGVAAFALLDPELLRERSQFGADGNLVDVLLAGLMFVWSFPVTLLVAGLDVGRYHWSPPLPLAAELAALGVFMAGNAFGFWAMMHNPFFSDFVKIQTARGHRVVADGPYAFVRHPGYAGGSLACLAMPVALGSWWALLPACVGVCHLIPRIVLEERKLAAELSGYRDYTARVRWRVLPGVW